jgi:hypothetical protein
MSDERTLTEQELQRAQAVQRMTQAILRTLHEHDQNGDVSVIVSALALAAGAALGLTKHPERSAERLFQVVKAVIAAQALRPQGDDA